MKYLFKKLTAVSLVCSLSMTAVFARTSSNITKSKAETLTFTETAFYNNTGCSYSGNGVLWDLFSDLLFVVWAANNLSVEFDDYPYASGKYLTFPILGDETDGSESQYFYKDSDGVTHSVTYIEPSKYKPYRYALSAGAFYFPETQTNSGSLHGYEARLEGFIWKFFGPVFEVTVLSNSGDLTSGSSSSTSFPGSSAELLNPSYNIRLGAQFSLIHSNWFDWSWYIQWTRWYGQLTDYRVDDGMALGSIIRMYPFKPVVLEWRNAFQMMNMSEEDETSIWTSDLEVGFMLNSRWELYFDWKYVYDDLYVVYGYSLNAVSAGLKVHW